MTHSYVKGVLTLTRKDGATITYPYNPETQQPFESEAKALEYANSRPKHWILPPTLDELKQRKIDEITINPTEPVTIGTVTYNGGNSSASAISGAIALAQALGETDVKLWDIDNNIAIYTFTEAQAIAAQIAQAYRDKQLVKYTIIAQINACTAQAELDAIVV